MGRSSTALRAFYTLRNDGKSWKIVSVSMANPPFTGPEILAMRRGAIETAFGTNVDFATITKKYVGDSNLPDAAHRYSPDHVSGVERTVIRGRPDPEKISTSYVEKFDLNTRMASRRFTRLTNAFSKKLEMDQNHEAILSPYTAPAVRATTDGKAIAANCPAWIDPSGERRGVGRLISTAL